MKMFQFQPLAEMSRNYTMHCQMYPGQWEEIIFSILTHKLSWNYFYITFLSSVNGSVQEASANIKISFFEDA